jgi:hypothetical protein
MQLKKLTYMIILSTAEHGLVTAQKITNKSNLESAGVKKKTILKLRKAL